MAGSQGDRRVGGGPGHQPSARPNLRLSAPVSRGAVASLVVALGAMFCPPLAIWSALALESHGGVEVAIPVDGGPGTDPAAGAQVAWDLASMAVIGFLVLGGVMIVAAVRLAVVSKRRIRTGQVSGLGFAIAGQAIAVLAACGHLLVGALYLLLTQANLRF